MVKYLKLQFLVCCLSMMVFSILSSSFQPVKSSKVEIKNLGLSKSEPAKVIVFLKKDDVVKLSFKDRAGNVTFDKASEFTLKRIPSLEVIQTGKIGDRLKNIDVPNTGDYIFEIKTSNKRDVFYNVSFEKLQGKWTSEKPPVTIKSTLLEPPSKNKENRLSINYPVQKNNVAAMAGEGKNASGITVEIPQLEVNTTMDKGFQQTITENLQLEVFMYLDEKNLKSKGMINKILSLGKKDKRANLDEFCEVKAYVADAKQAEQSSEAALANKPPSGNNPLNPKGSDKPLSVAEMKSQLDQASKESQESLKQVMEGMKDALKSDQKIRLLHKPQPPVIQNCPNIYDFTVTSKRKCTAIKYINESESQFFGYWVGISNDHFKIYNRIQQELKLNDPMTNPTPLSEYSNSLHYQKGITDQAHNFDTRPFPIPMDQNSLDNLEIALVDEKNKELFETAKAYVPVAKGLAGNTGQMYGFKSITSTIPIFLCSCNLNKQTPVTLYAVFETYTLPEVQ